jgi:hypothetical protein
MRIADQLQDVQGVRKFDVRKAARDSFIDRTKEVDKPPFCLAFLQGSEETGVLTMGDFSVVTGQAKSRKTFLVTMIVAALLTNQDVCGMIRGKLPEGKQGILYLDTEQSDWHAQAAVKRVEKLAGVQNDPLFKPHMLRDYSTDDRKAIFEYLIANTPELGFVVIDGIRDLVTSINDEAEAKTMVDWIMKLSKQHHCHILCVIHENKTGGQIRGTLGTELQNKAQAVLGVKKVENDEVSIVTSREARDKHFKPFAIYYNEETNLPDIDRDYEIQSEKGKGNKFNQQPKKKRLDDYTESEHSSYLIQMFSISESLRYSDVVDGVKHLYPNILVNDAKAATKFFLENGFLVKEQTDKDSKSIVYRLSDTVRREKSPF